MFGGETPHVFTFYKQICEDTQAPFVYYKGLVDCANDYTESIHAMVYNG